MPYKNTRPESPKGQVFTAFETKGKDAARKLGATLKVPESKLTRWLDREWTSEAPKASAKVERVKPEGKAERVRPAEKTGRVRPQAKEHAPGFRFGKRNPPAEGSRVVKWRDEEDKYGPGTVIKAGPFQTEVKFDKMAKNVTRIETNGDLEATDR